MMEIEGVVRLEIVLVLLAVVAVLLFALRGKDADGSGPPPLRA